MSALATSPEMQLAEAVGEYANNPLGFCLFAWPWGQPGPLAAYDGPDKWQREFLADLGRKVKANRFDGSTAVAPIREATSSGHGIGKSVLVAMLTCWIMSTRPHSRGTITANTFPQLETRTWAAIQQWMKMSITAHWFTIGADKIACKFSPSSWFVSAQTCREENSESFAGQHAATSTSFYIFDEASAIPDRIWEVAEGGLTDGEPMFFAFGNPTRNSGKFYRVTFGSERDRWSQRTIDSRECKFPNKTQISEWIQDYGEDSDFVRVRVRGLAPSAGDLQFIDSDRVYAAQQRPAQSLSDDPLIAGVDVARGGGDWNVVRFRKGYDARSVPPICIPGEQTRDSTLLVSKLSEVLSDRRPERKVAYMFVDAALGGPVVNRLRQLGFQNVEEVNFGSASHDAHQANMRAFMWQKMKDWLLLGAIDKDQRLEIDLTGPGFKHDNRDRLLIESKESMAKRGLASTDHGDGLALTFAKQVAPVKTRTEPQYADYSGAGWMS
jgi:hypothetical protein